MDDADLTTDRDEREAPARIAASRKAAGPEPKGTCHSCDEPVAEGKRWCDQFCREDWTKLQFATSQRVS